MDVRDRGNVHGCNINLSIIRNVTIERTFRNIVLGSVLLSFSSLSTLPDEPSALLALNLTYKLMTPQFLSASRFSS